MAEVNEQSVSTVLKQLAQGGGSRVLLLGRSESVGDKYLAQQVDEATSRVRGLLDIDRVVSVTTKHNVSLIQPYGAFDDQHAYLQLTLPRTKGEEVLLATQTHGWLDAPKVEP